MTLKAEQAANARTAKYELIGRIAAGLAHELNGPIGISLGFTELAREALSDASGSGIDAETAAKLNEYLGLVESSTKRARALSRGIWNFARSEPGTSEPLDLGELIGQAAALAGPAVKVGSLEIIPKSEAIEVTVTADRAVTLQALVQLMLASMECLPEGGSIYWEVNRSNDGCGAFTLTAEPWGDASSQDWIVEEEVEEAFRSQGGNISAAGPMKIIGQGEDAPSSPAWSVNGTLPAAAG